MPVKRTKVRILQPDLNERERLAQAERRKANPEEFPQTEEQLRAREQGVPLQAFRREGESQRSAQSRLGTGVPGQPSVTAEQIMAETGQRQQFEQTQAKTGDIASQLEAGASIGQVAPEAIAAAQTTPGIGTARTPQELLNQANTGGGAIRATLFTTIPTVLGTLGTGGLGLTGNLAGSALSVGSIGKFFNSFTSGKQTEVTNDIASQIQGAKAIVSLAHEDPAAAEKAINQIESNIINNYGKLHVLYTQDPFASVSGKDVEEDMATSLRQIQKYRQKIELYRRTGDPSLLIVDAGFGGV